MYDVKLNDTIVGSVVLHRQGAYYLMECNCKVKMTQRYHLIMQMKGIEIDLGLCLPNNAGLELKTRCKISEIGDNTPIFTLRNNNQNMCSFTVKTNEPFADISGLPYGRLNIQNGIYTISFLTTN